MTPTLAFANATSWEYDAGLLQVSGVELKSHSTQQFMSGYIKGLQTYWFNRGYVEGNNKLPMSSENTNHTKGYKAAIYDLAQFDYIGKLPPLLKRQLQGVLSGDVSRATVFILAA